MSIWGAFTNSVQAMNGQSRALGNISQNVANVATSGYKRIDSRFATLLSQQTGGHDIFSVANADRTLVDRQGNLQQTQRWNDIAINGQGFFVVNSQPGGGGETLFTRSGSFQLQPVAQGSSAAYMVDGHGNYLQGWAVNGGARAGNLVPVQVDRAVTAPGAASTRLSLQANIAAMPDGPQQLSVSVYDQAFRLSTVEFTFTPTGVQNEWSVTVTPSGGTASDPFAVTFDAGGRMLPPHDTSVNLTWPDGSTSALALDLRDVSQYSTNTALDGFSTDGRTAGSLIGMYFNQTGELVGSFTNGVDTTFYKLPVARFTSPNNLEERQGNLFAATRAAGTYRLESIGDAWQSTTVLGETLEGSNVDIAEEFSRMIMTQRAYSSAAQVFRTADEMTSLARQMKS